jgi:hypothetical protein
VPPPSPIATNIRCDAAHDSPRRDSTERSGASPQNSQSYGLRALGGRQPDKGSSVRGSGKQLQQYSRVAESLWDSPKFIQAVYHIGRYVIAYVNTEAKQEWIKALYSSMKTTAELIDVSIHILPYLFDLNFNSSSMQAIVKHSQDKDQFLKVSIKRMQETQTFEDELKEATEMNLILSTQNQELAAKLSEESRLKDGNFLMPFILNL